MLMSPTIIPGHKNFMIYSSTEVYDSPLSLHVLIEDYPVHESLPLGFCDFLSSIFDLVSYRPLVRS